MGEQPKHQEPLNKDASELLSKYQKIGSYVKNNSPFIKVLNNNLHLIDEDRDGNIDTFGNHKDELDTFVDIEEARKFRYFNIALKACGYIEINEDGVWNMYKLDEVHKNYKTGEILPNEGAKAADKHSMKYFNIWQDISFYEDRTLMKVVMKKIKKGQGSKGVLKIPGLRALSKNNEIKLKELELFAGKHPDKNGEGFENNGHGWITDEVFNELLPTIIKGLPDQCLDERFGKFRKKDTITKNEIEDYYERYKDMKDKNGNPVFPEIIRNQCIINLQRRENRDEERKKLIEQSQTKLRRTFPK